MPPFVPAEHIIATLVGLFTFLAFPLLSPLMQRIPRSSVQKASIPNPTNYWVNSVPTSLHSLTQLHVVRSVGAIGIAAMVWFAYVSGWGDWPFDSEHPKRVFISFTEDVSIICFIISLHLAGIRHAKLSAVGVPKYVWPSCCLNGWCCRVSRAGARTESNSGQEGSSRRP